MEDDFGDKEACEVLGISPMPWHVDSNADLLDGNEKKMVEGIEDCGDVIWQNLNDRTLTEHAPELLRQLLRSHAYVVRQVCKNSSTIPAFRSPQYIELCNENEKLLATVIKELRDGKRKREEQQNKAV